MIIITKELFQKCSEYFRTLEQKYDQDQIIDLWKDFDSYLQKQGVTVAGYQIMLKEQLRDSFLRKMGKPVVEKKIPIHR